MKIGRFFIDRPVFAVVLSVLLIAVGAIAYFTLPVTQYPEVVPPTVTVNARYPGANAQTVANTVAAPIEQEVNGVEGMLYMSSNSTSDGQMNLTITFKLGTDLDKAQVLVQNRVAVAEPRLPEEVRRNGVVTRKDSPDLMMVVHLLSPDNTYDQLYISNYALLRVRDVLNRLEGIGNINLFGARDYSMRVWLDPQKIASLNLTAGEVVAAIQQQNVQVAGGGLGQPPLDNPRDYQLNITLQGRLTEPQEFEGIIVKHGDDGRIVRLKDVARVELGARDYVTNSFLDGKPAVVLAISQLPGSNALETAARVREAVATLAKDFPPGLEYRIVYDTTGFIAESIHELIKTIGEAMVLVVLVVMLFLQRWRAAIIPVLAIPVSLIGTFAVMSALGYSVNNLTLFGLVLAVGIVVDDAIVVVENVERNLALGHSPIESARITMDEVGGALVSIALVLSAVFIPTAFIEGIQGAFYRQFAVTIAAATIISAFNSLTLSPALCARLLRPHTEGHRAATARLAAVSALIDRFFSGFNRMFDRMADFYGRLVARITHLTPLVVGVYVLLIAATGFLFTRIPGGFIPALDQGYLIMAIQTPEGTSLANTTKVLQKAAQIARETPGIAHSVQFAGFSGATRTIAPNAGAIFTPLDPFEERLPKGQTAVAVLQNLQKRVAMAIPEALIFVVPPPPIRGLGTSGGFTLRVQDLASAGPAALEQATWALAMAGNQVPGLINVFTPFSARAPQVYLDVDRVKAQMLGVPMTSVFQTLGIYLGSAYVNDTNLFGRTFQVTAQADGPFRLDPENIGRLETRNDKGQMVQLGSFVDFRFVTGPDRVLRYNLYPAAELQGNNLPGVSSGTAIKAMEQAAATALPPGFKAEWTDLSYQEKNTGNSALYIFPLCVFFVFLVLAAQYESWSLPFAILLIVPMCLLSAVAGLMMRGMDNNILAQIGFVVLVGLASKNAILIVEFARQLEAEGRNRYDAVIEACRLRLRPILMTSFAFILGVVPLMIATGAGAEMRQSLGTAVFFGMLGVTFFGLLFTPVFYVVIRRFAGRDKAVTV
ncbi:efflux RND transporter permease subunit [Niveispirillum cyanobacteriorum]|uniref:Efflux pump membrane transporter n=1 Tax=Niveispirillum cyanobacteriorum TaxID=1612173 RepID=A0A2K9NB33_9PROT|nr:multidrug efflux RND transporter permease subunit [Niveispirillum cyanobacteriorum]AUN29375.1 hydrophobe/amphiphile efflux-1 family RND transporter [Niveispirillum cyanobacteriorum]GGE64668.1 multidrug efflux RND transporter permease subunit [Niveispirillum cyanobacteriorum]